MQKRACIDDGNKKYFKVRDHCHFTRQYRGAADDICNIRYKNAKINSGSIS